MEAFQLFEFEIVQFVKGKQNKRNHLRCSQERKLLAVKLNSAAAYNPILALWEAALIFFGQSLTHIHFSY